MTARHEAAVVASTVDSVRCMLDANIRDLAHGSNYGVISFHMPNG